MARRIAIIMFMYTKKSKNRKIDNIGWWIEHAHAITIEVVFQFEILNHQHMIKDDVSGMRAFFEHSNIRREKSS
jgi:hypothetical protein